MAIEIAMNDKKIMVHANRLKPYKQRKGELPLFSAPQQQNPDAARDPETRDPIPRTTAVPSTSNELRPHSTRKGLRQTT